MGVPFLNCKKSTGQTNGKNFDFHAAVVLLRPLCTTLKATLFSSSETHSKQIVGNAISLFVVSEGRSLTSQNCSSTTTDVIKNFESCSTVLPKYFKVKCREILSSKRKEQKTCFVSIGIWQNICIAKRCQKRRVWECRLLHLQEAYEELCEENFDGSRNKS